MHRLKKKDKINICKIIKKYYFLVKNSSTSVYFWVINTILLSKKVFREFGTFIDKNLNGATIIITVIKLYLPHLFMY